MKKIREWIINWFIENLNIEEKELNNNSDENYFELGYIDSFDFIKFINDIEEAFGITFENSQFEDREFSTINGLTKIMENILENKE